MPSPGLREQSATLWKVLEKLAPRLTRVNYEKELPASDVDVPSLLKAEFGKPVATGLGGPLGYTKYTVWFPPVPPLEEQASALIKRVKRLSKAHPDLQVRVIASSPPGVRAFGFAVVVIQNSTKQAVVARLELRGEHDLAQRLARALRVAEDEGGDHVELSTEPADDDEEPEDADEEIVAKPRMKIRRSKHKIKKWLCHGPVTKGRTRSGRAGWKATFHAELKTKSESGNPEKIVMVRMVGFGPKKPGVIKIKQPGGGKPQKLPLCKG